MPGSKAAYEDLIEISRADLDRHSPAEAIISDVKHLASYNWIEARTPTISVPGCPARWSDLRGPRTVKKDSGLVYISQNAARHPDYPLEPLFRSLFIEQPSFDINSVDVVTDRNNIRKLLSFINPTLDKSGRYPFTIQVGMVGETAIFCRRDKATFEMIKPGQFRGYGHEFEKMYTVNEIENSTGHHRIISYQLGGLKFLVRHEVDGFVDDPVRATKYNESTTGNLINSLGSLSLSLESTTDRALPRSKLTIKREGRIIPRESTLEMKTRALRHHLTLDDIAAQLWISQTPKLVRAYHEDGEFQATEVEDLTTAVKHWERSHQSDIRKLVSLTNYVVQVTRGRGGSSNIQYDPRLGTLTIKKVKGKKMLPGDLYRRWTKFYPPLLGRQLLSASKDVLRKI